MLKSKTKPNLKEEITKFCHNIIRRVQAEHGFRDYKIATKFADPSNDDKEHRTTIAEIHVDIDYLRATIALCPGFIERYKRKLYDELEEVICHELSHIRTATIEDLAFSRWGTPDAIKSEVERLTEMLGRQTYKIMSLEDSLKKQPSNGNRRIKNKRRAKK